MNQHRGGATGTRNKWAVPPTHEYEIFRTSYEAHWVCGNEHNWGVREGLEKLGANDEKVAKFPRPSNDSDDRHGYPVSAADPKRRYEHRPPANVTSQWVAAGLITALQKNRIDKGKV